MKRFFLAGGIVACVLACDLVIWFFATRPVSGEAEVPAFSGVSPETVVPIPAASAISAPPIQVHIDPK